MSQDFKIVKCLRMEDGRVFGPGDEDKLLDASTPDERQAWRERELLEGNVESQSQREQTEIAEREELALATISAALVVEGVSGEPRVDFLERIAQKLREEQGKEQILTDALEQSASQISERLGIERSSEESAFHFIERFAHEESGAVAEKLLAAESKRDELQSRIDATIEAARVDAGSEVPTANGLTQAVNEALITRFGNIEGVAKATDAELQEIKGIAEASLPKVRAAYVA